MKQIVEKIKQVLKEEGIEPSEENATKVYNALQTLAELLFKNEKK
jgi:hypothetical protein